jgi:hypothetical protein
MLHPPAQTGVSMSSKPIAPLDLIVADSLLSEEERAIRETVRTYLEA